MHSQIENRLCSQALASHRDQHHYTIRSAALLYQLCCRFLLLFSFLLFDNILFLLLPSFALCALQRAEFVPQMFALTAFLWPVFRKGTYFLFGWAHITSVGFLLHLLPPHNVGTCFSCLWSFGWWSCGYLNHLILGDHLMARMIYVQVCEQEEGGHGSMMSSDAKGYQSMVGHVTCIWVHILC